MNKTMNELHINEIKGKKIDFTAVKLSYAEEVEEVVDDVWRPEIVCLLFLLKLCVFFMIKVIAMIKNKNEITYSQPNVGIIIK